MLLGLKTMLMNYTSDKESSHRLYANYLKGQFLEDNVLHFSIYCNSILLLDLLTLDILDY